MSTSGPRPALLSRGSWPEARRIASILRTEAAGGILLIIAAAIGLIWPIRLGHTLTRPCAISSWDQPACSRTCRWRPGRPMGCSRCSSLWSVLTWWLVHQSGKTRTIAHRQACR